MLSMDHTECLDHHAGSLCKGEMVVYHTDLGTPIERCKKHYDEAMVRNARLREEYPDSPIAPSWFDPEAAGERWDDDY